MIVAIGNAPSSGSTFLADLLDSLPFAICGPEIGLFSSIKYFTDFKSIKKNKNLTSRSPTIYQNRQRLLFEDLWAYGIQDDQVQALYRESNSFVQFCNKLFFAFASFRNKDCELFIEKTPQNIHCAKTFLDTFKDGFFLHIVRNPLFTYKSLIRRKFPPYIAANTWLVDVSQIHRLRNHPRLMEVKYESLIQNPTEVIGAILRKIGIEFEAGNLIDLYRANLYRKKFTTKINTWEIKNFGVLGNANQKPVSPNDLKALAYMTKTKISRRYAALFNLYPVSFKNLVQQYQYEDDGLIQEFQAKPYSILLDAKSRSRLLRKFISDFFYRESRIFDLLAYLKPVE